MSSTPFLDICKIFEEISCTRSRLEIQRILSGFYKKLIENDIQSLVPSLFISAATIHPQYLNIELGVGEHAIQLVVSDATGLSPKTVKQKLVKTGDLSVIAMDNRVRQLFVAAKRLTIVEVLEKLRNIASITGKDSLKAKKNIMLQLINASSAIETKYLIRLFETKLKIGLALQTILISLGNAFTKPSLTEGPGPLPENHADVVKEAYSKRPSFQDLVDHISEHGIDALTETYTVIPGVPLKPMLAQPCKHLTKAFSKVESEGFIAEYKYDGERVQVHSDGNSVKIFSRNLEDLSFKYPDIAALKLSDKRFILDGEVVAYSNGKILPFQVLSTRKRKHTGESDVKVCVFVFDILYFGDKELLGLPLSERRDILSSNFKETESKFCFAEGQVCKSVEDIDVQFKQAIQKSCEGVMIKSLASHYRPSHRTNHWIKIKNDYLDNIGDTLDLVVMGAYHGKGKRTGTYGGFLLGVFNTETEKYETCCKLGTGFSDERLAQLYEDLSGIVTSDISEYVFSEKSIVPDIWIRPERVWEIKAASLSLSPVYVAGMDNGRGISLRFPRFVKERRDKKPNEATTSCQLLAMYKEDLNAGSEDEFV